MENEILIWLNGKLVPKSQATVSVFDHGLLYGNGVFEGIRIYSGKIFELKAHIVRLYESAKALRLDIPMPIEQMIAATQETVKANNLSDGYIRLLITRGVGDLGLDPFVCKKPSVIIIAADIELYPQELYEKGLKVISSSVMRNHPLTVPPQVKSLNYINNIMAKIEAIDAGVLEAIMYNHQGYVAEATGDNVFIIKNEQIFTPPVQAGSLDGITRAVTIKIAKEMGYEIVEKNLTKFDLYTSDEFFLTGTAAEIIGVVDIDGRKIGDGKPGEITKKLREKFFEYAHN